MDEGRLPVVVVAFLVVAVLLVGLGAVLSPSRPPLPLTPAQREAAVGELAGNVHAEAVAEAVALSVIRASADFGIEEGVRAVPIRIVDHLDLRVRISADQDVRLVGLPRVCLVGPFWNPLDAGLSDRCWGEPDLGQVIAGKLPADAAGGVTLRATTPFELAIAIGRGEERCDYAPGEWRLQIDAPMQVDGVIVPHVELADVPFDVPLEPEGTVLSFRPNSEVRPCSYVAAVYNRQPEPLFEE